MNINFMRITRILRNSKLFLILLLATLAVGHLAMCMRVNNFSLLSNASLYWLSVTYWLWNKWSTGLLRSNIFSRTYGFFLILLLILTSISTPTEGFLHIFPLLSILGITLVSSSFHELRKYWQAFFIMCFLVPNSKVIEDAANWSNIKPLNAQLVTRLLSFLRFKAFHEGASIHVEDKIIDITSACSGINSALHLLGISVIFLMLTQTNLVTKILLPVSAILLALVINIFRIFTLAILARVPESFDYWHKGIGSHLNSVISVCLLFTVYLLLQKMNSKESQ